MEPRRRRVNRRSRRSGAEFGDDAVVIGDLCLDEYTDHGHCGVLNDLGEVENDATVELYQRIAVAQANAGAHLVGPSGMMDGQVAAIRSALDGGGHQDVGILAYAAKFASALYGPFREAAEGAPRFGDRTGYQEDPPNLEEALREIRTDIDEGADIVMVKPALPYLDVIRRAKDETRFPMAAYHVSGEYAMVEGRGRERLARRATGGAGAPDVDPARRRRPDPHVPRQGRGGLAPRLVEDGAIRRLAPRDQCRRQEPDPDGGPEDLLRGQRLRRCPHLHPERQRRVLDRSANQAELTRRIERMLARRSATTRRAWRSGAGPRCGRSSNGLPKASAASRIYRYDVIFLMPPLTARTVVQSVPIKEGVDRIWAGTGVVYFSRPTSRATSEPL